MVDVTPFPCLGTSLTLPYLHHMYLENKLNNKRQNELIPYNDCLYRNMYRYEYIVLLDIDEVITPVKHNNWAEMMDEVVKSSLKVKNETRASWNFRNVYFMDEMLDQNEPEHFPDIPPYLHRMQHVYRSANYTKPGQYVELPLTNKNQIVIARSQDLHTLTCQTGIMVQMNIIFTNKQEPA